MKIFLFLLLAALGQAAFAQQNPFIAPSYPQFENKHWIFSGETDSITGTWSNLPDLSSALLGVNSYYWPDSNKIIICGGIDSSFSTQTSCVAFNLSTNSYETKAPLPMGRWSGKLVRVRDSLYLVGSVGTSFYVPDGKTYRYSLNTNAWTEVTLMPTPYLIESAVCVLNDSLIVAIGGSDNGFTGPSNIIRVYNPWRGVWTTSVSLYPLAVTAAHAESGYVSNDTVIVVLGGYNAGIVDQLRRGFVHTSLNDSIFVTWDTVSATPFDGGVYRVSGCKWGDWMIFGPGIRNSSSINKLYGLRMFYNEDTSYLYWTRILPDLADSTANIPEIAVKYGADTSYFYFAGGYNAANSKFSKKLKTLSVVGHPFPIGIQPVSNNVPNGFELFQNYPNPFNPSTVIKFQVPAAGVAYMRPVQLCVFDILGREIKTLVDQPLRPGNYEIKFDGSQLASGLYFYSLYTDGLILTRKMILLK